VNHFFPPELTTEEGADHFLPSWLILGRLLVSPQALQSPLCVPDLPLSRAILLIADKEKLAPSVFRI